MPKEVYCYYDECIHNKGKTCTFDELASIIIIGPHYDKCCDEYRPVPSTPERRTGSDRRGRNCGRRVVCGERRGPARRRNWTERRKR